MDVTGDRNKVQCFKEQYGTGTWNVRSMNQWVNLTQITIISTTLGNNLLEEMD